MCDTTRTRTPTGSTNVAFPLSANSFEKSSAESRSMDRFGTTASAPRRQVAGESVGDHRHFILNYGEAD